MKHQPKYYICSCGAKVRKGKFDAHAKEALFEDTVAKDIFWICPLCDYVGPPTNHDEHPGAKI